MKIEYDIKLDFGDVLIRPKRSELSSRSQVNMEKTLKFCTKPDFNIGFYEAPG